MSHFLHLALGLLLLGGMVAASYVPFRYINPRLRDWWWKSAAFTGWWLVVKLYYHASPWSFWGWAQFYLGFAATICWVIPLWGVLRDPEGLRDGLQNLKRDLRSVAEGLRWAWRLGFPLRSGTSEGR